MCPQPWPISLGGSGPRDWQTLHTYLLKLVHVNVELIPQFCLRLGEGPDLLLELARLGSFGFRVLLLTLVPCHVVLHLELFGAHLRVEMQLPELVLLNKGLETVPEQRLDAYLYNLLARMVLFFLYALEFGQ